MEYSEMGGFEEDDSFFPITDLDKEATKISNALPLGNKNKENLFELLVNKKEFNSICRTYKYKDDDGSYYRLNPRKNFKKDMIHSINELLLIIEGEGIFNEKEFAIIKNELLEVYAGKFNFDKFWVEWKPKIERALSYI